MASEPIQCVYCGHQAKDHAGSGDWLGKCGIEKCPCRPVYCVHCEQFHTPTQHTTSFDHPPIPYAGKAWRSRRAALVHEMTEYAEGRLSKSDLIAAIERIDAEYIGVMHEMFIQRLI